MDTNAPDLHLRLLDRWSAALAARFPDGAIGVAGSVAAGRHGPASDLDLLVADRAVRHARQAVSHDEGVRVNVLCVHPERWAALLDDDAYRFAGVRTHYVLGVRVLRDPHGLLAPLQAYARGVLARRDAGPADLLATLRDRVSAVLPAAADEPRPGPRTARALRLLAEAALLKAGRTARDKRDGRRPFHALAATDPALHRMTEALVRGGAPARATLESAFLHVFPAAEGGAAPGSAGGARREDGRATQGPEHATGSRGDVPIRSHANGSEPDA
jgi:hypothetical protein